MTKRYCLTTFPDPTGTCGNPRYYATLLAARLMAWWTDTTSDWYEVW